MKKFFWNGLNSLVIVLAIIFVLNKRKENIVYIDNVKLYNEFHMTKELGELNEKKYKPFLVKFDSLVSKLKGLEEKLQNQKEVTKEEEQEYVELKRLVVAGESEVQNLRTQVSMEINKKVWERLNGYVKEFGKEKGYNIIMGAQGQGNIMYSKEEFNVTEDFIEFANLKYEGN